MLTLPRIEDICQIAQKAGQISLRYYGELLVVDKKNDKSPVTQADLAIDTYLHQALGQLTPDWPIVSEESFDPTFIPPFDVPFWLVDPLDGTRDFIRHNGQFAVNIALIYQGEPCLGIIYAPVEHRGFYATKDEACFWEEDDHFQPLLPTISQAVLRVVTSRSERVQKMTADLLAKTHGDNVEWQQMGSSLKFTVIAQGNADLFVQSPGTMPWDNAAGHNLIHYLGGAICDLNLQPLQYKNPTQSHPAFIVVRDALLLRQLL